MNGFNLKIITGPLPAQLLNYRENKKSNTKNS